MSKFKRFMFKVIGLKQTSLGIGAFGKEFYAENRFKDCAWPHVRDLA